MSRAADVGLAAGWLACAAVVAVTDHLVATGPTLWGPATTLSRIAPTALLVVAAAWWAANRPDGAVLALGAGLAWRGAQLAGSGTAAPDIRGLGIYAGTLTLPLLASMVGTRRVRVGWIAVAIVGLAWAAVYDPFLDPSCRDYCATNTLAVFASPGLADAILDVRTVAASAVVVASLMWGSRDHQLLDAPGVARAAGVVRAAAVVRAAGAVAVLALIAQPALAAHGHAGTARAARSLATLLLATLAIVPLAAGARRVRRLTRLRRLADAMANGRATSLQDGLRKATGDPLLEVAYRCADGCLVRADGSPQDRMSAGTTTELTVHGRPVATIECSRRLHPDELREAFGPASMLAAWNEALTADLRHQLLEVTDSRRRLLVVGDEHRRSLERDLHDGVQQGLLGALFELRRLERTADGEDRATLERAASTVGAALTEVRRLAAGLYPAVIERAGLEADLHSLIECGLRPVDLDVTDVPLPAAVAHTVHAIVACLVQETSASGSRVTAHPHGDALVVTVESPGREMPSAVADRVAALGGTAEATTTAWEVRLPCGS